MRYKRTTIGIFLAITFLVISILGQKSHVLADEIDTQDVVILTKDGTGVEYKAESTRIQYAGNLSACTVTPVQVDGIWMVPVKNVFSDILGCYYAFSEDDKSIVIKTPGRDKSITFTIDSDQALVNSSSKAMPAKVISATQKSTGNSDYMVPLEFTISSLGYIYSVQDSLSEDNTASHIIQIQSLYLLHEEDDSVTYDTEKYNNALIGIAVRKNEKSTKGYVQATALHDVSAENIVITQDSRENTVTLTFHKTFNPFGEITKEIEDSIIEKVVISQKEDASTSICIYYSKKYIYTQKISKNSVLLTLSKGSFSLKVAMPDQVSFDEMTTTDQYWNEKFLIVIPGDYVSFYKKYPPFINSSGITDVTVVKTAEGNTRIKVSTNGLKGYSLSKGSDYFTVKVGSPQNIYQNIVLLDAGHGGKDAGASGNGLKEKKLCLSILYTQAKKYFESNASTVKAYWTRHDDTLVNLYTRPKLSATYQADLFVSLHMNSASNKKANGTEVYYSKLNNKKASTGLTSKVFATRMQDTLVDSLDNKSRGVKQAGFVVLRNNTVPSVLVELGFVSGTSDAKRLKKESYQKNAAKVLYEGITDTFKEYPTGR